ncbi:MAG: Kinase A inhibitor [Hyphomonas sp. TMED17]|nr:MAG: Kinase A inhibitor [Hyphomonas sp. TMED17]
MSRFDVVDISDCCLEVRVESAATAQAYARAIRDLDLFDEVVPGLESVAILYHTTLFPSDRVVEIVRECLDTAPAEWHANAGERRVRIRYGGKNGPDFSKICSDLGVSPQAFISLHTARAYRVEMIGFTPGFSYLGGLSDKLNVPRLLSPRQHVPAGSIGICGVYTGIYAMGGPGGWPIIGHSADDFFDASKTPPFLIEPGMSVRFEAI